MLHKPKCKTPQQRFEKPNAFQITDRLQITPSWKPWVLLQQGFSASAIKLLHKNTLESLGVARRKNFMLAINLMY